MLDNQFFTVKELRNRISLSERGIRALVERDKISDQHYYYEVSEDGGRGNRLLKINPFGLPDKYKNEFIRGFEKERVESYRGNLPEWAIETARHRIDILHLLFKELERAKKEGRNITPVYDEATDHYNSGHPLPDAFEYIGKISAPTIQLWKRTYETAKKKGENIVEAMAPNYNTGKGETKMPDWYQKAYLQLLLTPQKLNPTRAAKILNAELRMKDKEPPVSVKTCQRFAKKYKKNHYDEWVLMREGQKALNDKVMPYIKRDWNLLDVGQVLIADGHVLNFDVKHPQTGKAHRPIMVMFYDGRSRFPVGISIMPTENIDNINEALFDSIQTLGKFPDAVILDNGRAFKAKHFTQSPDFHDAGIAGIYEQYGILTHFTLPYHGQSKPIEPFFNQFNERFSKMIATYRGQSIDTKVPRLMRNETLHKQMYDRFVGDWLPTIPETLKLIKHWAKNVYGQEEHSGLRQGETPWQLIEEHRGPGIDPALLVDLMFKSKTVTPRRAQFTIEGIVYGNWDSLTGINKKVLVRWTRTIPEKAWVFDPDDHELICVADAIESAHPLQKLTTEKGEFDMDYRDKLKERKKLEKRAEKTAKMIHDMNEGLGGATHSGHLLPNLDELPDASPNIRTNMIEAGDPDSGDDLKENGEPIFTAEFERFEYIVKNKGVDNVNESDIKFLKRFTEGGTYASIYKEQWDETIKPLIAD